VRRVGPWSFAWLLLLAALSGCFGGGNEPLEDTTSPTASPTSPTATRTGGGSPAAERDPVANLSAAPDNGTAPLGVNFTIRDDAGSNATFNWTLDLGDGNRTQGDEVPAFFDHTYEAEGQYEALLTFLVDGDVASTDGLLIVVAAGENATEPPQTQYSTGARIGCVTEAGHEACPAWVRGTSDTVFGFWIRLEPGHIGMNFTAKSVSGDSDAWVFADPSKAPVMSAHNGGNEAKGRIPQGAQWLLVFPWLVPTNTLSVTFEP
jgi:hypothetical protein